MSRLRFLLALALATGGGVAAASAFVPRDEPPSTAGRSLAPDGQVAVHVLAEDPDGGPPWGVRVYWTRDGLICPNAGRVEDGRFGRIGARGQHVPLPPAADGACADLWDVPLAIAIQRHPARPGQRERGVVFGVASGRVDSLVYRTPGEERALTMRDGAFLVVEPDARMTGATLTVQTTGGESETFRLDE